MMNKCFSSLVLSRADEMEIYLFNLLKTSDAPLILFDWIIDWVKRHEGAISQNGAHCWRRNFYPGIKLKLISEWNCYET